MIFCTSAISGVVAVASCRIVSSAMGAVSCGRKPTVRPFSKATVPSSGVFVFRMREKRVDLPAPLGPTRPIRSQSLTWSETSSKRVRAP